VPLRGTVDMLSAGRSPDEVLVKRRLVCTRGKLLRRLIFRTLSPFVGESSNRLVVVVCWAVCLCLLGSGSDFVARSGFLGDGDSDLITSEVRGLTGDKSTMSVPER
jgi:hypothetical protein